MELPPTAEGGIAIGPDVDPFASQETRIDVGSAASQEIAASSAHQAALEQERQATTLFVAPPQHQPFDAPPQQTAHSAPSPPPSDFAESMLAFTDPNATLFDDDEDDDNDDGVDNQKAPAPSPPQAKAPPQPTAVTGLPSLPSEHSQHLGVRGRGKTIATPPLSSQVEATPTTAQSEGDAMPRLERWQVVPTATRIAPPPFADDDTPPGERPPEPLRLDDSVTDPDRRQPRPPPAPPARTVESASMLWSDSDHPGEPPRLPTQRPGALFAHGVPRVGQADPGMAAAYVEDALAYLDALNALADDLDAETGHQLRASSLAIAQKLRRALDMLSVTGEDG